MCVFVIAGRYQQLVHASAITNAKTGTCAHIWRTHDSCSRWLYPATVISCTAGKHRVRRRDNSIVVSAQGRSAPHAEQAAIQGADRSACWCLTAVSYVVCNIHMQSLPLAATTR